VALTHIIARQPKARRQIPELPGRVEARLGSQGQPKSTENTMFPAMAGPFACLEDSRDAGRANRSTAGDRDFGIRALANRSQCEVLKMTMGLVGRKCGMTRVFTADGDSIPVTVIEAQPNRVTQVKTVEADGYRALQVTSGGRKPSRVSKPEAGHFAAAKVEAGDLVTEFRLNDDEQAEAGTGTEFKVDLFEVGQRVDVIGTSIGKGYAGTVKRHNFRTQDATHGNSLSHRAPGSIGQNQSPGRVFPGKKMSGHMGNARRTVQNLEIVRVDAERNLLLIKGAVPGHRGGRVIVRPSVKAAN
jgi:large subunit ribosomal protein L3